MKTNEKIVMFKLNEKIYPIKVLFTNNRNVYFEKKDNIFILKINKLTSLDSLYLKEFMEKSIKSFLAKKDLPSMEINENEKYFYYLGKKIFYEINNDLILFNINDEIIQLRKTKSAKPSKIIWNFLNEKLKEKMIYFNYKDNEKQQAKNLFRNSLYIIRRYRNEIAHSMDFINYRAERYIIFRYLKKILNEYGYIKLMNKNDYSKRQRGSNDIFSMILSIILLLGNEFLRIEMLKELEMFINKENKEKFKSYAEITNLPDNFLDRLQETLKEKKNNYLFRS